MREYEIFSDEEVELDADHTKFAVNTIADATEADMKLLQDMHTASSSGDATRGDGQEPGVQVKKEPHTEQEKAQTVYEDFCANAREHHWAFTKMQIDIADMDAGLSAQKWTEELRAALKKHATRMGQLVKLQLKATSEKPKFKEFPRLQSAMDHLMACQIEFVKSVAKFGVSPAKKKRRA